MSAEMTAAVKRAADEVYDRHSDREAEDVAYNALDAALDVEEMTRVLGEHRIECTGLEGVTCRGCRGLGWMPRYAFEQHQAAAIRTALLGADS